MTDGFRFEYRPGTLRYGDDSVRSLADELTKTGTDRALVVTGRTVGATPAVMDPVRAGLGDRLAGVVAETTPEKRVSTAARVATRARETGAGALVAVGGGSSLDVATVAAALLSTDTGHDDAVRSVLDTGTVQVGPAPPPVLAAPTTLAGADLSQVAGITADPAVVEQTGAVVHGGVSDPRLAPAAVLYDPDLFRTTPASVLLPSAMNGFDKAVETVYARTATPVTDATALRALRLLRAGLPALGAGERDDATMRRVLVGTLLAQYGVSRSDAGTLSLLHAFGHVLSRRSALQQGAAHGLVAPAALTHLFESVDARRHTLAEGLRGGARLVDGDIDAPETDPDALPPGTDAGDDRDPASAVVREVRTVRDALGLDRRLRDVAAFDRADLPALARATLEDGIMANTPQGYDPDEAAIQGVLASVW